MGERKGQNKYYPPDFFNNAKQMSKGLDAYHGHDRLRERGKKAHLGIIVVRFEMPYNIWCNGCKNHIGMGVRYNAEKMKVGSYYSTPIYEFKMKCHLCDNYFHIKTDPANLDYEITSGARRQENRWDPKENEQIVTETKETQRSLIEDSMFKLEHVTQDKKVAEDAKPYLYRLLQRNDNVWNDSFDANSNLRVQFKKRKSENVDTKILNRTSLNGSKIKLLAESEEDKQLAGLLKLQSSKSMGENSKERLRKIMKKPVLPNSAVKNFKIAKTKEKSKNKIMMNLGIIPS